MGVKWPGTCLVEFDGCTACQHLAPKGRYWVDKVITNEAKPDPYHIFEGFQLKVYGNIS